MADRENVNSKFGYYIEGNNLGVLYRNQNTGKMESYSGEDVQEGIRLSYTAKYNAVKYFEDNIADNNKVDSGLHVALLDYVKARLEEDMGNADKSMYFKSKYRNKIKSYPHSKKGQRGLKVPNL